MAAENVKLKTQQCQSLLVPVYVLVMSPSQVGSDSARVGSSQRIFSSARSWDFPTNSCFKNIALMRYLSNFQKIVRIRFTLPTFEISSVRKQLIYRSSFFLSKTSKKLKCNYLIKELAFKINYALVWEIYCHLSFSQDFGNCQLGTARLISLGKLQARLGSACLNPARTHH